MIIIVLDSLYQVETLPYNIYSSRFSLLLVLDSLYRVETMYESYKINSSRFSLSTHRLSSTTYIKTQQQKFVIMFLIIFIQCLQSLLKPSTIFDVTLNNLRSIYIDTSFLIY